MIEEVALEPKPSYSLNYMRQLRNRIQNSDTIKVVLGAGDVWYGHDWIATNIEELNAYDAQDWDYLFGEKRIDVVLCEHVWEHIGELQTIDANKNVFKYLKEGGLFRLAVPDGNFPNQDYIDHVKPNGIGSGSNEHTILYTYDVMRQRLFEAGFIVDLVEYWDENKKFFSKPYDESCGIISRSLKYDERNVNGELNYTSIIVDAIKP